MVSVIIPVYNCELYLAEAIESTLAQTVKPGEIIVVDDGSTDDSARVARRFRLPVRCVSQPNSGAPAARNRGAKLARGEFLSFLDADDLWLQDKLALQMACFEEHGELDLVNGHIEQFISPDLDRESRSRVQCPRDPMPAPGPVSMLIRRESLFRVGLFDTRCAVGELIDWYAKAMDLGLRSFMLPDVVVRRRVHRDNISYLDDDSRSEYLRIVRESLARRRKAGLDGQGGQGRGHER
jgi:glycosyltransferase involved in cell wall biosynthesis